MITPAALAQLKELTACIIRDQAFESWSVAIGCEDKRFCDDTEYYWEDCPYGCDPDSCEGHFPPGLAPFWVHGPNWVQHHDGGLFFPQSLAEWVVLARNLLPELLRQYDIYQQNTTNLTAAIRDIGAALHTEDDDDWE